MRQHCLATQARGSGQHLGGTKVNPLCSPRQFGLAGCCWAQRPRRKDETCCKRLSEVPVCFDQTLHCGPGTTVGRILSYAGASRPHAVRRHMPSVRAQVPPFQPSGPCSGPQNDTAQGSTATLPRPEVCGSPSTVATAQSDDRPSRSGSRGPFLVRPNNAMHASGERRCRYRVA